MRYISSDTNIWIDFIVIQRLEYPFRLGYTYCMSRDAIEDELLSPKESGQQLLALGLEPIDITDEELHLAFGYRKRYIKISAYDAIALAIAKARGIVLLTGDRALRKAAQTERVEFRGSLWILDQLMENSLVTPDEYRGALIALEKVNGSEVRLPPEEIRKRLEQ